MADLDSVDADSVVIGGKAAALAALVRAGFPVPWGYVVTVNAYRAFVTEGELQGRIDELLRSAPRADTGARDAAAQAIRRAFAAAPVPPGVAEAIVIGHRRLGEEVAAARGEPEPLAVAVRSSATAEDLPTESFAGQHDSYLNVWGEAAVIDAVRRCWASLWTARAVEYRAHHGIDPDAVAQAVLVQEFVAAEAAGVLFTQNAVTGTQDEVVINAAWGLGESVVGGHVVPDSIVVDKATGRIKHLTVATKNVMTVPAAHGTRNVPVDPRRRRTAVLDESQIAELVRLGVAIEAHRGMPQDIEWVISHRRTLIVQARPVTGSGMPRLAAAETDGAPIVSGDDNWPTLGTGSAHAFDLWTRANVGELWPDPVSPLVASTAPLIITGAVRHSFRALKAPFLDQIMWARRLYGRIYYNEGALAYVLEHELGLPPSFIDKARGNRGSAAGRDGRVHAWRILRHLPVLIQLATRQRRTALSMKALLPRIDRWVSEFEASDHADQADRALWTEAMIWLERTTEAMKLQNDMSGVSLAALATLERLVDRWFGRPMLTHDLISGLSGIQAAEVGSALWQLADAIDDAGLTPVVLASDAETALRRLHERPDAEPIVRMLDGFLRRHGHRCANEAEWLYPRWRDAPDQVIELVAAYLGSSGGRSVGDRAARQSERREEAVQWVESRLGPVRRKAFRMVLRRAHQAIRLRDNGKSSAIKASYPARQIAACFGQRWTERGWLGADDDIFFLTANDLALVLERGSPAVAGLDLAGLVRARRRAFEAWFDVEAPDVIDADGRPVITQRADAPTSRTLRGIAASAGSAQGIARVILDPHKALGVRPGEILVTRATDVGWSAIFPLLGGLVTEIGGQLSHAAILAREYSLPAVVNVDDATRVIQDGQRISIDGLSGHVCLEPMDVAGRPGAVQ